MERLMNLFKKKYDELELTDKEYGGDKLILDNYRLADGVYKDISTNTILIVDNNTDKTTDLYKWFVERDMYSGIINQDTNYGIENKKKILSTNCYSLFFKAKISLKDCINNLSQYYSNLKEISGNHEIDNISNYMIENIEKFYNELKSIAETHYKTLKEQYIKIFFNVDFKKYKNEELKYLKEKILSGNKIENNNQIYGIGNLTNLNTDKKFLIPTTLKNGYSQLVTLRDATINQYKFLIWLRNQPNEFYIPLNYDFTIQVYNIVKNIKSEYAYFIKKSIKDKLCDVAIIENKKEIDFEIFNLFENVEKLEEDFKISEWWKLLSKISYVYFKETNGKIKINKTLKESIAKIRSKYTDTVNGLFNYNCLDTFIGNEKLHRDILKVYLLYGESKFDLMKLINLNQSLINYKNEGDKEYMQDRLYEIREKLDNIDWKKIYIIKDDIEFAYIGGQLANYFNYIRQSKEKHYDFVVNFINSLNTDIFIDNIVKAFEKTSYKISIGSRSNVLLNALLSYKIINSKVNKNAFIIGSIDNNCILKKNDNKKNNEEEGK